MGVPEQLRRLDEDLATGRVDAESYRRRRDEILASRLPEPPAVQDDLDDSELDAADHELGLDEGLDGAADQIAAVARAAGHDGAGHRARPDEQNYRIVVDDHGDRTVIKAYDSTMDPAVADLLDRVRRHPAGADGDG